MRTTAFMVQGLKTFPSDQEQSQPQKISEFDSIEKILKMFSRIKVSMLDLSILKKFYMPGNSPFDTSPQCLPILYCEIKKQVDLKTGYNNFYHRTEKLRRAGFIEKIDNSNPTCYNPVEKIKYMVRKAIVIKLAQFGFKTI